MTGGARERVGSGCVCVGGGGDGVREIQRKSVLTEKTAASRLSEWVDRAVTCAWLGFLVEPRTREVMEGFGVECDCGYRWKIGT